MAVVAVLGLGYTLRSCQGLEAPPRLTDAQGTAAVGLAAAVAGAEVSARSLTPAPHGALGKLRASEPVFVTVYGPGRSLRRDPAVGWWTPTPSQPELPLDQAIGVAAREAGRRLGSRGAISLRRAYVKVDLLGAAVGVWPKAGPFLEWLIDPGRIGLRLEADDRHAWWLPSWTVERGQPVAAALRVLQQQLGGTENGYVLARFRSTSFVGRLPPRGKARRVVRGNALAATPTHESVRQAIVAAGRYLAGSNRRDGTYCYTYRPLQDDCATDYNLLRHAGTTYSLYQILEIHRDHSVLRAAERASAWLRRQARTVDGDPSRAYLVDAGRAKLGAAGLTLMALVERERVIQDGRDRELCRKLADFLISQQHADGYFDSYFAWRPDAPVPKRNSIYYPGEAVLGLVRLYGIDRKPRYVRAARLGAEFLVKKRWRWAGIELYVPPDAWLTQALAELDAISPAEWIRDYANEVVELTASTMLRPSDGVAADLVGGPAGGLELPRVTPAGARLEGSTAAWAMAVRRGHEATAARWRKLSLIAARFQLNQQYRPESSYFLPNPRRALGAFRGDPNDLEVRIDYVQHTVSGLIGTLKMLRPEAP